MNTNTFDSLSFYGPWRKALFGAQREKQLFSSLAHWYEAARFDERIHPERFQEMLLQATPRDCVRLARRNQAQWRADWQVIRSKVLIQGLWLTYLQNQHEPIWNESSAVFADELCRHGIEERFMADLVQHFLATKSAPRVLVIGAAAAPPKEVGRRINALHRKLAEHWVLVHWMGRHVSWDIHDWADSRRLPLLPMGRIDERFARDRIGQVLTCADQVLVFEKRGGKSMDKIIKACKAAGKPLEVALWADESVGTLPEVLGLAAPKGPARARGVPMGDLFGDA